MQLRGGIRYGQTAVADIGYAIAIRVRFANGWTVSEIGAEAVGGAEAGAFAQEHEGDGGFEEHADFILQRDASLTRDDEGRKRPAAPVNEWQQRGQERLALGGDGVGREATGDNDGQIERRQLRSVIREHFPGLGREPPAQVGTAEKFGAVARRGLDHEHRPGQGTQARREFPGIEG